MLLLAVVSSELLQNTDETVFKTNRATLMTVDKYH